MKIVSSTLFYMLQKSAFKEQKKSNTPLVFDIVRGAGMVEEYTVPAYTWFLRKHVEDLQVRL